MRRCCRPGVIRPVDSFCHCGFRQFCSNAKTIFFGIGCTLKQRFQSELSGRSRRGLERSDLCKLLGYVPLLLIVYTVNLVVLTEQFRLFPHRYADDTQVYGSCCTADVNELEQHVSSFIDAVSNWMRSNRLLLNTDKTDVIRCATR